VENTAKNNLSENLENIDNNILYEISVNAEKNRIYQKVKGFWKSAENYLEDLTKSTHRVRRGFTVITDITEAKTPSPEVVEVFKKAGGMLVSKGMYKLAEIIPKSATTQMAVKRASESSKVNKMAFTDLFEAEKWLDEK
jgi:hypothetical protein